MAMNLLEESFMPGSGPRGRVGKPVYSMYSVLYFNIMIIVL